MSSYSVTEAESGLAGLIDRALQGEEVLITRDDRAVVELRPAAATRDAPSDRRASLAWLRARREARPQVGVDSAELLRAMADERPW